MSFAAFSFLRRMIYGPRVIDPEVGPSEELKVAAHDLNENLKPYLKEPDPLVALMTDLFNKRAAARRGYGEGNGSSNDIGWL